MDNSARLTGLSALIRIATERGSPRPSAESERFLDENFPGLVLAPPLFHSWPIGLRFELGASLEGDRRIEQAVARAVAVYEGLFASSDEAMIVGSLWPPFPADAARIFDLIPGDAGVSFEPGGLDASFEDDTELPLVQAYIQVQARDLDYRTLVRWAVNSELGAEPALPWQVFILNLSRQLIYYLYDDRGLGVVAAARDNLIQAHRQFHDWLLEHDRP
jgi:hypothetical protein